MIRTLATVGALVILPAVPISAQDTPFSDLDVFQVEYASDVRISPDDMALVLPDGSIATPAATEIGSLPGDEGGITTADRSVSFVVDEMPTGNFTLRLALDALLVSEDGITEATFDFEL